MPSGSSRGRRRWRGREENVVGYSLVNRTMFSRFLFDRTSTRRFSRLFKRKGAAAANSVITLAARLICSGDGSGIIASGIRCPPACEVQVGEPSNLPWNFSDFEFVKVQGG
jgi:hypothetical protein